MPSLSVFGAQWGDEGKGKIIDLLACDAHYVVRYQGGPNAGHTVVVGAEKYVLHLVPSGILHPGTVNVIGNGVAIDPLRLREEILGLRARGVVVDARNLRISERAHVIFDHHRVLDRLAEQWRGAGRIGTTGRGIGPCYADKAARVGLRMGDLVGDPARFRSRLQAVLVEKNAILERVHGLEPLRLEEELERYRALGAEFAPHIADTGAELRAAWRAGRSLLFEGAQGVMLDLDHGTYPYVTSSSTGPGGIAAGAGFPPGQLEQAIGIAKAYCTRVGEGPFPTEERGEVGDAIRVAGNEFGATTGRPRRCGWFDAVAARYALELSGADGWVMTNLDVLTGFDPLRVGIGYRLPGGEESAGFPALCDTLDALEVRYESHPGWSEDITAVRSYGDLPKAAREYVERVEELVGCPVVMLSVGPDRDQVISRGLRLGSWTPQDVAS